MTIQFGFCTAHTNVMFYVNDREKARAVSGQTRVVQIAVSGGDEIKLQEDGYSIMEPFVWIQ